MPDYKACTGSCGRRHDGDGGTSEDLLGVSQAGDGKKRNGCSSDVFRYIPSFSETWKVKGEGKVGLWVFLVSGLGAG